MATLLTYNQFVNKYEGRSTDVDGSPSKDPVQCVDLAKAYFKDCFGIPYFSFNGSAKNVYENFNSFPQLVKLFDKIPNTKTFVPEKGDVAVWGSSVGGGNGHIAICTSDATVNYFYSFDQNWSIKACHKQYHNYKGFLGVLRPKDRSHLYGNSSTSGSSNSTQGTSSSSSSKVSYYPKYTGKSTSIVEALASIGVDSSYTNRKKIAKANGIEGYSGTSSQNAQLVKLLKEGKLKKY